MIYELTQKVLLFFTTHRKNLLLLLIPLVLIILSQIQIIYIHIDTSRVKSTSKADIYAQTPGGAYKLGAGLRVTWNDVQGIHVQAGEQARQYIPLHTPFYRFSFVSSTPRYAYDATRIAYQNLSGTNCSTYNSPTKTLLSYDCTNPINLKNYTREPSGQWVNTITTDISYINAAVMPYRDGVLGITRFSTTSKTFDNGAVTYTRGDGTQMSYPLPKDIAATQLGSITLMTHFTDPSDKRFVITNPANGYVYTAVVNGDSVVYITYTPTEKYPDSATYNTTCRPTAAEVVCYRAMQPIGHGSDKTTSYDTYISHYGYSKKSDVTTKVTNKSPYSEQFYVTDDGYIYGVSDRVLYRYNKTWFGYHQSAIAYGVSGVSAGTHLRYVSNNAVYELTSDTEAVANAIFYSPRVFPVSAFAVGKDMYVLGKNVESSSNIFAYKLSDKQYDGAEKRIIDVLPAKSSELPWVGQQYLVGNQYHATLNMPISKRSMPPVEEEVYELRQQETIQSIEKLGVDIHKVKLSFGY